MSLLRSEWLKWRTIRSHWVLLILGGGIPMVVNILTAAVRRGPSERSSVYSLVFGASYVTAMVVGVLGAVATAAEFGHRTIRPTFVATPRRGRVLLAKSTVVIAVGSVTQLVVAVVSAHVSFLVLEQRGLLVESPAPAPAPALIGSVLFVALMGLLGHGLGCLMRSTPLSITTIILWPLLVEGLVGALISIATRNLSVGAWMPFQAGFRLLEYSQMELGDVGPGRLVAGLYFGGVVVGLSLLASAITLRRDA